MGKLIPAALLFFFAASVSSAHFSLLPADSQAIAGEKTKSYQHFTLVKKADSASQVRHLFAAATAVRENPRLWLTSPMAVPALQVRQFNLSVFTLDIPPPA